MIAGVAGGTAGGTVQNKSAGLRRLIWLARFQND